MIIFVDQRIVADLLYKVLKDDPRVNKSLDVVYSHGNKSVFNKTLKKLNIESDKVMEAIRDIIDFENIQSRSLTQQRLSIENFKTGKTKVLIATSVIEEGLDIPQCNQILVFDKIRTPKTYIQMSGRARKVDSKITFLCLETEYHNTKRSKMFLNLNFFNRH